MTEILHHLSTCHSTLSLGVRGYKLCISKSKVLEVVQDFFHPPKEEKDFLYFWSCKFLPSPATSRGSNPQTRYLSSPAAAILHGKTQGFVLRLPPQNIAHATFMQPLQCVSQHPVANLHPSTHVATSDDDNQAAIPMQSATTASHSLQNT